MRVIALMNQKGGVGKTTTAVNLGAALAEAGKRVCMIDLDPQSHLTINYGIDPSPDIVSLYHVLIDETPLNEAIHHVGDRLDVVPSNIDLAAAEIELVTVMGREMLLKNSIDAARFDYDFLLLDCPPSLGLLTINGLCAVERSHHPDAAAVPGVAGRCQAAGDSATGEQADESEIEGQWHRVDDV